MPAIVTFDFTNLRIVEINTGSPAVNEIDATEIYSEWKQALLDDASLLGFPQAFTPVGGDPRTLTQSLGITRFLENGWRIRPAEYSHKLAVNGNLFTREPGQSIFVSTLGAYNVHTETVVSNVIDTMTVGGVDQATVQAALTAQGYTPTRAPKIDLLDALNAMILAVYQLRGLDVGNELVLTPTTRKVPADGSIINQTITTDGGTVIVERVP